MVKSMNHKSLSCKQQMGLDVYNYEKMKSSIAHVKQLIIDYINLSSEVQTIPADKFRRTLAGIYNVCTCTSR